MLKEKESIELEVIKSLKKGKKENKIIKNKKKAKIISKLAQEKLIADIADEAVLNLMWISILFNSIFPFIA